MESVTQIGLVGDQNESVLAHRAIPLALQMAAETLRSDVRFRWLPTIDITSGTDLVGLDGIWCIPASPYRNRDGALRAIRWAREQGVPFLGTCGGFQHAIIEYARNVLDWPTADHAESSAANPDRLVISALACALVEVSGSVRFAPESKLASAYGALSATEGYHCRFGVNPQFADRLFAGGLQATAWDETGEVRAVELADHPFFVATLFQPERAALVGNIPNLPLAFVQAAVSRARLCALQSSRDTARVSTNRGE